MNPVVILDHCPNDVWYRKTIDEENEVSHSTSPSANKTVDICPTSYEKKVNMPKPSDGRSFSHNGNTYTCCEEESCDEVFITVDQFPNQYMLKISSTRSKNAKRRRQSTSTGEVRVYKEKDLIDYLGTKDGKTPELCSQIDEFLSGVGCI